MKTLLLLLTMPLFAHSHIVDYGTWYQWKNVKDSTGLHVKLVERTPPIIIKDSIVYDTTYLVSPVSCPECPERAYNKNDIAVGVVLFFILWVVLEVLQWLFRLLFNRQKNKR